VKVRTGDLYFHSPWDEPSVTYRICNACVIKDRDDVPDDDFGLDAPGDEDDGDCGCSLCVARR
jgi:hypothetical protein